jgi:carbon monoxide dehydrogenase subunit G
VSRLTRDIEIDATPQEVWGVLMDPDCLGDWVTIQEELEDAPDGDLVDGSQLTQRLKVAGRRFHLKWTVVEADKPKRAVWKGRGPLGSKATVIYELFHNGGGNTRFHYTNEYHLPLGPLGRVAGRAIVGASETEADKTLGRLKALVEQHAAAPRTA